MSLQNLLSPNNLNIFSGSLTFQSTTPLNYYEEFTLPVNYQGIYNTPLSRNFRFVRIGKAVVLHLESAIGNTNNTNSMTFSQNIPTRFMPILSPGNTFSAAIPIINSGDPAYGTLRIFSTNEIIIQYSSAPPNNSGIDCISVQWITA